MSDRSISRIPLLRQLGLAFSIFALAACGGGGGGSSAPPANSGNPVTSSSTISGTAAKGLVKNGVVTIFAVNNGARGGVLVSGVTDATGSYSLVVPDYSGPIIVEISAGQNTRMICDLSDGCGNGVVFGADLPLSDGFTLQAVQEVAANESVDTHINPLTSMAASLAIKSGISSESVASSNAQVATLFNLTGALTDLVPVDITNPDLLVAATDDQKRLSLLSSALVNVGVESGQTVAESLASLSESFADNDGQMVLRQSVATDATTLEEIYTEIDDLLDLSVFDSKDLGQIEATFNTELAIAKLAPDNTLTAVVITAPLAGTLSDIARAFVSDIRDLGVAATLDDHETAGSNFADKLDMAANTMSGDTEVVFNEIMAVAEVLAESIQQGSAVTQNGIAIQKNGNEYSFQGAVNGVDVDLTATGSFSETTELNKSISEVEILPDGSSITHTWVVDESVVSTELVLVGVASNAGVQIVVGQGSNLAASFIKQDLVDAKNNTLFDGELVGALDVKITQLGVTDASVFEGELEIDGSNLAATELFTGEEKFLSAQAFEDLSLLLGGKFSRAGESFSATLSIVADGRNYTFVQSDAFDLGETADSFVDFSFSLSLTTQLTGISDNTTIQMSGDRTAVDNGNVTLKVGFEGKRYTIKGTLLGDLINGSIQNQGGVLIELNETRIDGETVYTGDILVKGETAGSLVYERGNYLFRYVDGQFESF